MGLPVSTCSSSAKRTPARPQPLSAHHAPPTATFGCAQPANSHIRLCATRTLSQSHTCARPLALALTTLTTSHALPCMGQAWQQPQSAHHAPPTATFGCAQPARSLSSSSALTCTLPHHALSHSRSPRHGARQQPQSAHHAHRMLLSQCQVATLPGAAERPERQRACTETQIGVDSRRHMGDS